MQNVYVFSSDLSALPANGKKGQVTWSSLLYLLVFVAAMLNAVARASSGILRTVQPTVSLSHIQNGQSKVLPALLSKRKCNFFILNYCTIKIICTGRLARNDVGSRANMAAISCYACTEFVIPYPVVRVLSQLFNFNRISVFEVTWYYYGLINLWFTWLIYRKPVHLKACERCGPEGSNCQRKDRRRHRCRRRRAIWRSASTHP